MFEYHYNYLHYYFPQYYVIMREREREKEIVWYVVAWMR